MKNFVAFAFAVVFVLDLHAQDAASAPSASSDVESLRQQVQALTETVKELQQQVNGQQAATEKSNGSGPSSSPNPEESPVAATSPSPAASPRSSHFATEDASVVSST